MNMDKPKFTQTTDSCGPIFRAEFKGMRLEMGLNKNWLNIIDDQSHCECCLVEGVNVVSDSGECVTGEWSDADWTSVSNAVREAVS